MGGVQAGVTVGRQGFLPKPVSGWLFGGAGGYGDSADRWWDCPGLHPWTPVPEPARTERQQAALPWLRLSTAGLRCLLFCPWERQV